jgi:hypothetical protein
VKEEAMKARNLALSMLASLALIFGGCATEDETRMPEEPQRDEFGQTGEEMREQREEAVEEQAELGTDSQKFVNDQEEQLAEWESELQTSRSKVETMGEDVRAEYERREADLRWQFQQVRENLSTLNAASEEEWDAMKGEVETRMSEVEKSYGEFKSWLDSLS